MLTHFANLIEDSSGLLSVCGAIFLARTSKNVFSYGKFLRKTPATHETLIHYIRSFIDYPIDKTSPRFPAHYTVNVPLDKTARNETSSRNKSPKTSQQYKIMVDESRTILINSTRMNWAIFFDILGLILKMMCQACARGIDVQ